MSIYVPNEAGWAELVQPTGLVGRATARAAGTTRDRAKVIITQAPRVDTGALRQSVTSFLLETTASTCVYRIGTPLEYAIYVHEGTGIFGPKGVPIRPRRAKALRWIPKDKRNTAVPFSPFVYAKSVKGSPGVPFLTDALDLLSSADFE